MLLTSNPKVIVTKLSTSFNGEKVYQSTAHPKIWFGVKKDSPQNSSLRTRTDTHMDGHPDNCFLRVGFIIRTSHFQVYGEEMRHGYILSVIETRKIRKSFDTKKEYSVNIS